MPVIAFPDLLFLGVSSFSQKKRLAYCTHVAVVCCYQFLVATLFIYVPSGYGLVRVSQGIYGVDRKKCPSVVLLLVILCRVGNLVIVPFDRIMLAVVEKENKDAQRV